MRERFCRVKKVVTFMLCIIVALSLCTFAYATEDEQIDQEGTVLENEEVQENEEELKEVDEIKEVNGDKSNKVIKKGSPVNTLSDTDIIIDKYHFPDETFRTYLLTHCDWNEDEILSANEINSIKEIDITDPSYEGISDLTGIEYFTSLEWLLCSGTSITRLDLTQVPTIRVVYCDECSSLTSIDVTNCKNLDHLSCAYTQISEINVTTCSKLEFLNCTGTNVSSIDLSQNPNLLDLYFEETPLTSIDVSQNKELESLICSYSKLKSVDVSNHEKLQTLACYLTDATSVNVDNCPELHTLLVGYTKIKTLDVTTCPKLRQLYCTRTAITEIDISKNPHLHDLAINRTNLTSLDISHNSELFYVLVHGTNISTLDVTHNPNIESIHCYNTPLYSLDVGTNSKIRVIKGDSIIDMGEIEDTFDMAKEFPGIDISKVKIISGAILDQNTGIVSDYKDGTPIVYTYDSGEVKDYHTIEKKEETFDEEDFDENLYQHGSMSLKVTLTFHIKQKGDKPEIGDTPSIGDKPESEDTPSIENNPVTGNSPTIESNPNGNINTGDELYLDLWIAIFMTSVGSFVLLKRKRV